jgi:glutamine amidotransferase/cyclase
MAPLRAYLDSGRPFMGICIGMQVLCQGSDESPGVPGLGLIPAAVKKFKPGKSVPHMGWNGLTTPQNGDVLVDGSASYYFVHSFALPLTNETSKYAASTTQYGNEVFVSAVRFGNVFATQFHPEKSGQAGLAVLRAFLTAPMTPLSTAPQMTFDDWELQTKDRLTKRIVACLDVRSNDDGDLIVTKGDQYDVREKPAGDARGTVRNLGKPVELAKRYYQEGILITYFQLTNLQARTR